MQVTDAMVAKALDVFISDRWSSGMDAMRAALTAALAEVWRPIEDAPKDGRHVMLAITDEQPGYVAEGYYSEYDDAWFPPLQSGTDMPDMRIYPSHWQSLPSPPPPMGRG